MIITERIHNLETGETVDIEREETAQEKKYRLDAAKQLASLQAEAEAKDVAKQAIADRLGLTADELKLLLG
jgi:regulator of protease activity HflC (stomatin/prohibitin superfamily)